MRQKSEPMKTRKSSKKSPKDKLKKELESLWKETCKKRDDYKCQYCGSQGILQVHHIVSRKNASTFFDIDNGITLCQSCHTRVTFDKVFQFEFQNFLAHRFGQDFLDDLERRAKQPKKWGILELEEKMKELKEKM